MRKTFVALILALFLFTVPIMATVDLTSSQINPAREAKNINPANNDEIACRCMTINSLSLNSVQFAQSAVLVENAKCSSTNNFSMTTINTSGSISMSKTILSNPYMVVQNQRNVLNMNNMNIKTDMTGLQIDNSGSNIVTTYNYYAEKPEIHTGVVLLSSLVNNNII